MGASAAIPPGVGLWKRNSRSRIRHTINGRIGQAASRAVGWQPAAGSHDKDDAVDGNDDAVVQVGPQRVAVLQPAAPQAPTGPRQPKQHQRGGPEGRRQHLNQEQLRDRMGAGNGKGEWQRARIS